MQLKGLLEQPPNRSTGLTNPINRRKLIYQQPENRDCDFSEVAALNIQI